MRAVHLLVVPGLLALAAFARADGVTFEEGSPAFADVLAKAKEAGKPVFVDFSTESCGWCMRLDADVLSHPVTAETMRAFVNLRVDPYEGEGVALAKKYQVRGYPTLLVVDAAGAEIDRIVGYERLDDFNADMKRILRGEWTIADARKRHLAAPNDPALAVTYGEKLLPADPAASAKLFEGAAESKEADARTLSRARLGRVEALAESKRPAEALDAAEAMLPNLPADTPFGLLSSKLYRVYGSVPTARALRFLDAASALPKLSWSERSSLETHRIDVYQRAIVDAERRRIAVHAALPANDPNAGNLPYMLDMSAWTCCGMKRNLKEATQWARTAVEKSGGKPSMVDTLAHLLWLQGQCEEALRIETEAEAKAQGPAKFHLAATVAKWKIELAAGEEGGSVTVAPAEDDGSPVLERK